MTRDHSDPSSNPDVFEALTNRYSNVGLLILPLKSGRFALFDRGYNLVGIHETFTSDEIRHISSLAASAYHQALRKPAQQEESPKVKATVALDLDL